METASLILELRPECSGAETALTLRGTIETIGTDGGLGAVLRALRCWAGRPVEIALFVDARPSSQRWFTAWVAALDEAAGMQLDLF